MQTAERVSFQDPSDNVIFQRHLVAYQEAVKHVGENVLEVGCGEGYGLDLLADKVKQYTAIDKYAPNLDRFEKIEHSTFVQMTIPPIEFPDETYDSIVSFQVIEHIEDDEQFVSEIARVMKPQGTLVLTTPNKPMSLTRNPWHVREYLHQELQVLLERHFSEVRMYGVSGNKKVDEYYAQNKASVERITRWDILNLQYRLPRKLLQIPYDILNRLNRRKLLQENDSLVSTITAADYHITSDTSKAFDFFCIAKK